MDTLLHRLHLTGRRLAAVAAVLHLLLFQRLYPGLELVDELFLLVSHLLLLPKDREKSTDQLGNQRDYAFFALEVRAYISSREGSFGVTISLLYLACTILANQSALKHG